MGMIDNAIELIADEYEEVMKEMHNNEEDI